ncbi:Cytochrome p450 [Globisporangium polare]
MLPIEQLTAFIEPQSVMVLVVAVIGVLLGVQVLRAMLTRTKEPAPVYPQPASTLPILGNTLDALFFHSDRIYDWITEESLKLDRPWLMSFVGSVPIVPISSPELFEDIMKTQFDVFTKGEDEAVFFVDLFGKGILNSDGDAWYFHRKTASNLFSNQMMRDVMYTAVEAKVKTLCEVLRTYESRGEPISFKAVISQFTSDVFGKIGFGVDLDCLENGVENKKGNEFIEAFSVTTKIMFERYHLPKQLWQLMRQLHVGSERVLANSVQVIDKFIFRIINESIAKKNAADDNGESSDGNKTTAAPAPKDLISLFLSSNIKEEVNLKGKAFDSEMHLIRDTVVNFIFAGKDTTSNSLAWFIVMMNRHPAVLEAIRAELREKLSGLTNGELAVPSIDDLPQLTYLEAAIRENLRLNPVVSMSPRQAKRDTALCDGTPIHESTRVLLSFYTSARNTSVWGDDALEFKPERWIDPDTGKLAVVSPFKAGFFYGGPRQCIGMKFAMMELKSTLAVLLSKFDFTTVEDPWTTTYEPALTMPVKGPLLAKVASLDEGVRKRPGPLGVA